MGYVGPEEKKEHVSAHSYVPEDADEFRLICLGNEDKAKRDSPRQPYPEGEPCDPIRIRGGYLG